MTYPETLPLEGGVRLPGLIIEAFIIYVALHVALLFFKKYKTTQDKARVNVMYLAWCSLFICFAITIFFFIIADYFTAVEDDRYFFLQFGYVSLATGGLFFLFHIEKIGFVNTKRLFTVIFGILFAILIVLLVISQFISMFDIIQTFSFVFLVPSVGLIIVYTYKVNKLIRGKLKVFSSLMIAGLFILILGYVGNTDFALENIGLYLRVIADFLQILGIVFVGIFFGLLPGWKELEWVSSLHSLFVIYKGGTHVFQYDFQEKEGVKLDPMMVAGTLETTRSILNEAIKTASKELKVLDVGDKKILIQQGGYVSIALIANQDLESLRYLLHSFIVEFEGFFVSVLPDWEGDVEMFAPTKVLVKKIFG
ncbi:MAG: hypothetical protein ACFFCS_15510 [Candidatus Hodarchaeota archaeon]